MRFRLLEGGLSTDSEMDAMEKLTERMHIIVKAMDLFNASDWQVPEVGMWLEYEKSLALTQAKLYDTTENKQ